MKPLRHIDVKIELGKDESTEAISDLVSLVRKGWQKADITVQVGNRHNIMHINSLISLDELKSPPTFKM